MIYLYLFGTCFHFIYVFMIIGKYLSKILSMSCICIYPHIRGGSGIPIFSHNIKMSNHWKLEEAKVYNEEIVRLHYSRVDITEK